MQQVLRIVQSYNENFENIFGLIQRIFAFWNIFYKIRNQSDTKFFAFGLSKMEVRLIGNL